MILPSLPLNSPALDQDLLAAATGLLTRVHRPGRHEVAAALRTRDGAVHLGVHLEGSARRTSICAEGVAMGAALTAGGLDIDTVLAVHFKPAGTVRVIAPCGVCRDLMFDYCPDAYVYVFVPEPGSEHPEAPGTVERLQVSDLLPVKTRRRW
ncbi:cytidine deaminase [Streptomyces sp. NPDC002896]|uniref:cytidine deaminase n=1 Tax=Streptomyces sp. NPDC002896 TaxID=3154438 RepID=UPI003325EFA3